MSRTIGSRTSLRLECLEAREVPALMYAITNSQRLVAFDSTNPTISLGSVAISGMAAAGEKITDIDVRVGGGLYGRSDHGLIYLINPQTGSSTQIGGFVAGGASIGMDFDPTQDQLRVVNFSGGNVAVNPSFGSIAAFGTPLRYGVGDLFQGATPHLSGLAFTNSIPFALTTQLFGIDHITNSLAVGLGDPNAGQFATVGFLGLDITNRAGFDIDPFLNVGYVALQTVGSTSSVFGQINLATGALGLLSPVTSGALVLDIAVSQGLGLPQPTQLIPATNSPFPSLNPFSPPTPPPQVFPTTGSLFPDLTPTSTPFPMTGELFPGLVQPLGPGSFGSSPTTFGDSAGGFGSFGSFMGIA